MPSTRRTFLTASGGTLAALAGCANVQDSTDSPSDTLTAADVPTPSAGDADRATQTPRAPTPLDVSGAWPQRGFDAGHASVTDATGVPIDGEPYWHLRRVRSGPPLLADGRLFHYALLGDDTSGTPTLTQTPPAGTAQPLDGRKALLCRDASDGRIQWTRSLDYRSRWPTVADGHVVVAGKGAVAAFRTSDGRESWRHDLGDRVATVTTASDGTVLVSTQFVRESDREPDVRAYRASDGTRRWTASSPKWQAGLACSGDTVFALSAQHQVGSVLTARALSDGDERWSVRIDDDGLPRAPLVAGRTVYVSSDRGLLALEAGDGSRRWREEDTSGVAATDDGVYAVQDGRLGALDPDDANERWSVSADGDREYRGVPAVGREAIYVEKGGFPADVVALDREDGSERWSYRLPETVVGGDMVTSGLAGQPTVAEGAVYAYAQDCLYAFGPAEN